MAAVPHPLAPSPRPFVGRADIWQEIDALLSAVADGHGRGLILSGPGGVGKSEVLRATTARALRHGIRVGTGRGLPDELPAPFALVRDLARSLGDAPTETPDAPPPTAPALSVLFVPPVELAAAPPRTGDESSAAASPSGDALDRILAPVGRTTVEGLGAGRDRLFAGLIEHFLGLAREGPLLLAIDDLPFVDPSSLEFLGRLSIEIGDAPIGIVGTRGPVAEIPEAARELLARLERTATFRELPLRPLTVAELAEFVTVLQGGIAPAASDVERWFAQTDGNPLFVEALVRSAMLGGPRDAPAAGDRPDLVAVLLARIRALDDPERRVLTYGAILGREFDFARLTAVTGLGEERLSEALDRLVQAGLLREKWGEVYEFVSEAVRASVYSELTETRRRILHRRVGAALEARGDASNFELARQFYLGRDEAKTVEYNLRAAEAAARTFAFDAAISHLVRALEGERRRKDRDPRREVRLLTECGRLLHETGELARSQTLLAEAVALARALSGSEVDLGRALLALAWTRADQGEYGATETLAAEALAVLERAGTPRDRLSAHRVLGTAYWRTAETAKAEAHQRIALEIAERDGTPVEQGHALIDVANTLFYRSAEEFAPALAMYRRAAELFGSADDPSAQARVLMNRAVLEYGAGRAEEAFLDLDSALAAAERSRSPLWIGYCLINLAQWDAEKGEVRGGTAALERAVATLAPVNDLLAEQQIAMSRGMLREAAGDHGAAEAAYADALARARSLHLAAEEAELQYRLAELAERAGDRAGARRWLAEAEANGLAARRPDLAPRAEALGRRIAAGSDPSG